MKKLHTLLATAGIALAVSLPVHAQVKIGVIASSTGAIPFVGIPQKNAVALLPTKMGDLNVEYIVFDDASDPTQSVQLSKKLLSESKIDALIGPSGSGNAMGVLWLHGRSADADAGPGRHLGRGAADGRQEALGVQDPPQ
jgi:branched-chain amino acid transport system substrate-binding protein